MAAASIVVGLVSGVHFLLGLPVVLLVFAAARGVSGPDRPADHRNFSDVAVLWSERGVPPETMRRLREIEQHLGTSPSDHLLEQWWDIVTHAIEEQRSGAALALQPPAAPTADDSTAGRWSLARQRHERVAEAWTDLVCDPLAALTHCSLFDVANPATAAFIESLGRVDDFISIHGTQTPTDRALVDEYADLARAVETTWDAASALAERVGFDWLPESERADAQRASRLLALAASESAPLAERATAAERAAALLRRIHAVVLPDAAMQAIDSVSRGEIEGPDRP